MITKRVCAKYIRSPIIKITCHIPTTNEGPGTVDISLDVSHPTFAENWLHQIVSSIAKFSLETKF